MCDDGDGVKLKARGTYGGGLHCVEKSFFALSNYDQTSVPPTGSIQKRQLHFLAAVVWEHVAGFASLSSCYVCMPSSMLLRLCVGSVSSFLCSGSALFGLQLLHFTAFARNCSLPAVVGWGGWGWSERWLAIQVGDGMR